jgi:glycosyltransferase involved in cell wall biosynthesis
MNNFPLVSICIPTYNSEAFVAETIKSVLNQTYSNVELILCDDCSSDNTVEIIGTFKDSRVKFYSNEKNLGIEGNWNKTLILAKGKYLKLMGADDILFPDCISDQMTILEDPAYSEIVLVTSHKRIVNETGKIILSRQFPGRGTVDGVDAIKKCIRRGTNVIGEPVAGLYRADILSKSGMYSSSNVYLIDLDLWSRILKYGKLYVVDKYLFAFRISGGSISAGLGLKQYTLFNGFVEKISEDRVFHITTIDKLCGRVMSLFMVIIRNLFHLRFYLSR